MTKARKTQVLWAVGAILFFVAAMLNSERAAVYIVVGVLFLILSSTAIRKERPK
jgi:uncharacterized membrane protein